jgi:hypothetical protein
LVADPNVSGANMNGEQENRRALSEDHKTQFLVRLRRALAWARLKLPFGLRTVFGLVFVVAGVFGFLPVLGFWMVPVGLALVALDIPPLRRRLQSWLHKALRRRGAGRISQSSKDET